MDEPVGLDPCPVGLLARLVGVSFKVDRAQQVLDAKLNVLDAVQDVVVGRGRRPHERGGRLGSHGCRSLDLPLARLVVLQRQLCHVNDGAVVDLVVIRVIGKVDVERVFGAGQGVGVGPADGRVEEKEHVEPTEVVPGL